MDLQAIIRYSALWADGNLAFAGSVRNASCTTGLLNVNSTYRSGRIPLPAPVYLLLLDQRGLENLLNPSIAQLTPTAGCQAGLNTTSCAFTISGLSPNQAYHLWLVYPGNASASEFSVDGLVTATFASGASVGEPSLYTVTIIILKTLWLPTLVT